MYKPTKRLIAITLVTGALLGVFGVWVLLHPASVFVQPWRAQRTATAVDHVMFGPYPVEADFVALKNRGVTTIVSLLEPNVPYENVLLEQERERAARHGMVVLNFPMGSILGQKFGADYMKNSKAAAVAALNADGVAYIHCYLGLHRAKNVQDYLASFATTSTYVGVQSDRPADIAAKARAEAAFDAGNYALSLAELDAIPVKNIRAAKLEAWTLYRLLRIDDARAAFARILQKAPDDADAQTGLAYCALFENQLVDAGARFAAILARHPGDPAATEGLGYVRFREGKVIEARALFEEAARVNPANVETRQMLDKLRQVPEPATTH